MTTCGRLVSIIFAAGLTLLASFGSGESAGGSVHETLDRLYRHIPGSQHLVASSAGVLVFPPSSKRVLVFAANMAKESFETFRRVDGWKVGVDGSVAILTVGAGARHYADANRTCGNFVVTDHFVVAGRSLEEAIKTASEVENWFVWVNPDAWRVSDEVVTKHSASWPGEVPA